MFIIVTFGYYCKKEEKWKEDKKEFDEVTPAFRFIWKCKRSRKMYLASWVCSDADVTEYLIQKGC